MFNDAQEEIDTLKSQVDIITMMCIKLVSFYNIYSGHALTRENYVTQKKSHNFGWQK